MSDAYLKRWSPELRRAVMKVRPEYFSWPQEQRERYAVSIPEDDSARLDQALLHELFGRTCASPAEAANAAAELPLSLLDRWNETLQPLVGIGKDSFSLEEHIPDGKTILDFPTLRALDEAAHAYQEAWRKTDVPGYTGRPYKGALDWWAKMFVDGKFAYATLSMAADFIRAELQDLIFDVVKECIPYREIPGRDHGKWEGDSWRWDMRADADGLEGLVDELEDQAFEHADARFDALEEHWHNLGRRGVCILDDSERFDRTEDFHPHFVFTDVHALQAVRFRSFLQDCRAIERPAAEIEEAVTTEKDRLAAWIRTRHGELLKTFDPKIAKLRKRRRIMIHKDAFRDLT